MFSFNLKKQEDGPDIVLKIGRAAEHPHFENNEDGNTQTCLHVGADDCAVCYVDSAVSEGLPLLTMPTTRMTTRNRAVGCE